VPGVGELFAQSWAPERASAAAVIIHGGGEHSGRYDATARWLVSEGYLVCAADLPGHGRSPGIPGHINRFDEVVASADAAVDEAARLSGCPKPVLIGHSLGGMIASVYAAKSSEKLRAVVMSSPSWELSVPVPAWKKAAAFALSPVWPSMILKRPKIAGGMLTHDAEIAAAYDADPLVHEWASLRFYTEFRRVAAQMPRLLPGITAPALVLQAGDDRVVSAEATRRLFPLIGSADKQLIVYEGLHHEILNERERARVRADLLAWLRAR
jgi:lysophospholipase